MLHLICLLLSVIFAALATGGVPELPRFHFLPAAVLFLALSFLLATAWRI